ncbi:MAG: 23S rRNA (guanosine(2251)-2'-O)-methyltransferase RlmB, partial [Pseudoflavonifractor sp.]
LVVVCDELSDPHNLGAVIRTAECAGAHGVIIPKRRSAGLTAIVAKTSAGAVAHIPVARVPNLTAVLQELKDAGLWVFGADAAGDTPLYAADLKGPAVIVIGNEGEGIGRLVLEQCDFKVSIPMKGKLNSLNASAAAAIMLYEAVRQRMGG